MSATPTAMWLLDEASSGTTPTTANDTAAGTAVNLTITFGVGGAWTSNGAGDGISFAGTTQGAISGAITATKLGTGGLTNSKIATFEFIFKQPLAVVSGVDGIFGVTSSTFSPDYALFARSNLATSFEIVHNDSVVGNVTVVAGTTYVVQIVYDSAQATAAGRVKCYLDGSLATINAYSAPALNAVIPIDAGSLVTMACNVTTGNEPAITSVFYAAIYCGQALSAAECLANATNLAANNDANPNFANPIITTQPQTQRVPEGATPTFTVAATGTNTLHYQWKVNGGNVGSDQDSYTWPPVAFADNGSVVTVDVTDDIGTTTSDTAILVVYEIPSVAWFSA